MTPFSPDQYIILALVFVLGLVLGMYLLAGGKWKRRYKEEARIRAELERENKRLHGDVARRDAAAAHPVTPTTAAPVTPAPAAPPAQRRGGLWGLGRAKH
jgi:hypothetical protein